MQYVGKLCDDSVSEKSRVVRGSSNLLIITNNGSDQDLIDHPSLSPDVFLGDGDDSFIGGSVDDIFGLDDGEMEFLNALSLLIIGDDPRPHLQVKICGEEVVGLMDSGASCTIFGKGSEEFLSKFQLSSQRKSVVVRVADGNCKKCNGVVEVPITFNGATHLITTLVVPEIDTFLTLGMNFWDAFGFSPALVNSICSDQSPTSFIPLDLEDRLKLDGVINTFLATTPEFFGCTTVLTHRIDTGSADPVRRSARPVPYHLLPKIDLEIERLVGRGVLRECPESPWLNPIQVVVKKKTGAVRLCLDGRWLNQVTIRDSYAIPHIEGIINRLEKFKYLSSIDLSDAFLQIPLEEDSQIKTAFAIPGRKMYCYQRMPFGLMNSPMTMARLMNIVIGIDLEPQVFCFLDDIIVATPDFESHLEILGKVSERLRKANLSINVEKSQFCAERLDYLGYTLSPNGISTSDFKVSAIINFPAPQNVTQLRQLLGMIGWFRRFVPEFASIAKPLTDLLKGGGKSNRISWTVAAENSFSKLKELLTSAPVLKLPDYSKPFIVRSDASDVGAGGVLLQEEDGQERVICYVSKKFSSAEQNYTTTEKEAYGCLICLRKFAPFLLYKKFRLETDHSALLWILRQKEAKGRVGRWVLEFQQYDFDIVHRPGRELVVPDVLSRNIASVTVDGDKWYDDLIDGVSKKPDDHPEYKVENDFLFKHCKVRTPLKTTTFKWKCCVRHSDVRDIIQKYHDSPNAAHFGFAKTYRRISSKYYWPNMRSDVRNYLKRCEICKQSKSPNVSLVPPMGSHISVSRPWEHLALDFLGPLIRSSEGYCQLLVIMDRCTKFVLLYPLRSAKASAVIKILSTHVFPVFGIPRVVFSDNGPAFVASIFESFLQELAIKHWFTAAYAPQSNPVERANRTIITAIKSYVSEKHSEWPKYLSEIGMAIRSSVHDSMQYSPYYMNFGQEMISNGEEYTIEDANKPLSLEDRLKDLKLSREEAKRRLRISHESSRQRYNLRSRPKEFDNGDIVYRRSFALSDAVKGVQSKFCPWIKCKVVARKGQVYELEDMKTKRRGMYHGKDIKPG